MTIEDRLSGMALAQFRGQTEKRGKALVDAIADDLAQIGLPHDRIAEALTERTRFLGIRHRGQYPDFPTLDRIAAKAVADERERGRPSGCRRAVRRANRSRSRRRRVSGPEFDRLAPARGRSSGQH